MEPQPVQEGTPIAVPGIVLQEVLSGAQTREQFERLEGVLQPFTLLLPTPEHHVVAARIAHTCRANGVATTTPDTLVAATTILAGGTLLTWDADFTHIAQLVPMGLRLERD